MPKLNLMRYHGGKTYQIDHISSLLPPDHSKHIYVEGCIGGGSFFLNKDPAVSSVINDLDPAVYALWYVIKNEPERFMDDIRQIAYDKHTFLYWKNLASHDVYQNAIRSYVVFNQSRGGIGKSFGWSNRLRGNLPGDLNAWINKVNRLGEVADKMKNTEVLNSDIRVVLENFNDPKIIHYIDPPYPASTRSVKNVYTKEMPADVQQEMLSLCNESRSKILISTYRNSVYTNMLKTWNMSSLKIKNHSGQGKKKSEKEEIIYYNY